jgi:hypothetical protein
MLVLLVALIAIVGAAGVYATSISRFAEFNRTGLFGSRGRISSGSKFGIKIGQDTGVAIREMKSLKFEEAESTSEHHCHSYVYDLDRKIMLWRDVSWRKGVICIISFEDRVEFVSWAYGMGYP